MKKYILTKIINFLLLSILIYSCKIHKTIYGEYIAPFEVLKINKDSSYIYEYRMVFLRESSHGSWKRISDNKLVLFGDNFNNIEIYKRDTVNETGNYFEAKLVDGDTLIEYFEFYALHGGNRIRLNLNNGLSELPNSLTGKENVVFEIVPREDLSLPLKYDKIQSEVVSINGNIKYVYIFNFEWWMFYGIDVKSDTVVIKRKKLNWKEVNPKYFKKI